MKDTLTELVREKLSLYGISVGVLAYNLKYKRDTIPTCAFILSRKGKIVHLGSKNTVEDYLTDLEK